MDACTLVAVAKNEGRFIKEWVLYHKLICDFDRIIVYNNDSEDDSEQILHELSADGLCEWINWPRVAHNPPQPTAYRHALSSLKGGGGWLCCLDIDEFLFLKEHIKISTFLRGFGDEVGSVSFNWSMFYSLDEKTSREPVTKSVDCFLEDNAHVKTIARLNAIRAPCVHSFRLAPGFKYMHCSGFDYGVDLMELSSINMSLDASLCTKRPHIDCSKAQVNHYRVKSKEYCLNKDLRGCASSCEFRSLNSIVEYEIMKKQQKKQNEEIKKHIEKINCNFYNFLN